MAEIRETLTLEDRFSAAFSSYISMGAQAAGAAAHAERATGNYQAVLSSLDRQIISLNGQFEAAYQEQSAMQAAGMQNTAAFAELETRMDQLGGTIRNLDAQYQAVSSAQAHAASVLHELDQSVVTATVDFDEAARSLADLQTQAEEAAEVQERTSYSFRNAIPAAGGLISKLAALAGAYLSVQTAQRFVGLSDTWTQTTARLERMNDGVRDTAQLQDLIYQSAQRTRGSYQDTADLVAKLGTLAGEAFNSTEEIVAFAEQINMQFALAGTSAQGAQAAILQLTQAMSSGVLRGEELNSILEQAPTITAAIADYLGVSIGEMRQLASEGLITAAVVKDAVFDVAGKTSAAFANVPLTFSQAADMAGNAALNALRPAMQRLNDLLNSDTGQALFNGLLSSMELVGSGAEWLVALVESGAQLAVEHGDLILALLAGLAAGALLVGGSMLQAALVSAAGWAMANLPLLLIVGSIALIIYMALQMGAAWEQIGAVVGGVSGGMYAALMNLFLVPGQNMLAAFGNFIGNLFNDPLAAVKMLFLETAQSTLGHISSIAHGIEDLINAIPGMSVNLTSKIDAVYSAAQAAAQSVRDSSQWVEYFKPWEYVDFSDTIGDWAKTGGEFGSALDNFSVSDALSGLGNGIGLSGMLDGSDMLSGLAGDVSGIGSDTSAIRREISMTDEDIRSLVELAERRYVNNINLTSQSPVINIAGQNTGNTEEDRRALASVIAQVLMEEVASGSVRSTQEVHSI